MRVIIGSIGDKFTITDKRTVTESKPNPISNWLITVLMHP